MDKILYLIVPCYNEEEALWDTSRKLENKLDELITKKIISPLSRVVFVDDGSQDNSWEIIEDVCQNQGFFQGLKLFRNQGQQIALWEGISYASGYADVLISIDCDLQDDIEVIDKMLSKFYRGSDIVYGAHSCRKQDSFFKKTSAKLFYKTASLFDVNLIANHSEFRLMSKRVMEDIVTNGRDHLPIRCFVSNLGYPSDVVEYSRQDRKSGTTKYNFISLISLAWSILIGFSVKPVRLMLLMGGVLGILGTLLLGLGSFVDYFRDVKRYLILIGCMSILAGIVVFSLGVVGCYLTKLLDIVSRAPSSCPVEIIPKSDSFTKIKLINNNR